MGPMRMATRTFRTGNEILVSKVWRVMGNSWRARLGRRCQIRCCGVAITAFHGSQIAVLDFSPKRARCLTMATESAMKVTYILLASGLVVVSSFDGIRAEDAVEVVSIWNFLRPFFHLECGVSNLLSKHMSRKDKRKSTGLAFYT
jgi:hypothetical protein